MPRSRSKKIRRRRSRHIRHKGRRIRVSRRIKKHRRVSRRQMRGGSNQWTCARKSSKDNKLYETVSPGEKIQTLLSDNRFTSSRGSPSRGEYSEGKLLNQASPSKLKLPPKGPPPPGTLQRKSVSRKSPPTGHELDTAQVSLLEPSSLQKPNTPGSNKKAMKNLGKSRKTTRKLIEDNLAKRRKVIAGEHSAQNPGFNPDN